MGLCQARKLKPPSACDNSFSQTAVHKQLQRTCHLLILYLDLIGDTHSLGGYLQDRICKLKQIQQILQSSTEDEKRIQSLQQASVIIEFLYQDGHFSQAFPILRESLHEIAQMTQMSLSPE